MKKNIYEIPDSLAAAGEERHFSVGMNIFHVDERITHCYLILSGMVKIYIDHENGRRSILDFSGKGDWLGELSLFRQEDYIKENKVIEDVVCLEFELDRLKEICQREAEVSYYFASYISNKLMVRSYRLSEYLNYSLEKRLASFILKHQQNGKYTIPHTDVSEYMNISYRHVLFIIKKFCDDGILKKDKGYRIMDYERLKEISDGFVS
ncbi:MAG TPA: Crp/Fnr family transcriptional regulator [Lachnoclostridium sp.]|jgi:CRP/FNR family putative post-exponential-phase nitrogen-starvation transcriptional regulator|uniref:cyclic nucleotide-binding domain-containing protein n=1 Tax=Lacrimispora sp. TaxID=2719234 RepID=UPI000ECE95F9|nr:cyclic nucleotide-binding domain-containing protein [Lacrimispora sp.]HCD44086.1 Crp/Fnr family transcriptional regulator [Lachnoclostridium sp.]